MPIDDRVGGEERKLATVLFADLVGSTALGGSQDPERVRVLLERFYDAVAEEILAAGGTVEKFAGDAVMAAFGAPTALEDHAERALHASLAMQRRLAHLFQGELELRIGVETGEVVVGRAREGSSFVTGDSVNIAARLEQAAAPGEILVGERTSVSARGAFEFDDPLRVEAKGKPGGVACRRLVRALSLMRPRGVGGRRTAFVGRDGELETLREAYRRVLADRRPYLVTILGDAGVGKTRLAREFWEWLGAEASEPLRRTGRCLPYGRGITYWALSEILKEHFDVLESDSPETLLRRLEGREILALTLGLDVAAELHPLVARDRLHAAWVELASELAARRPAVVLVEDLHWAEDELLDVLELLLRAAEGRLLLLATARTELLDRRPGWGGARRAATTIDLEPLSVADSRRMLDELLASELPEEIRNVVVEHGEGNPFFVEEILETLIDRGVLAPVDGGWTARELPTGFAVPDTVQAVVAARIDLLPAAEKSALQAASVIGRVFWPGPVYELVPDASPDFGLLEERDFIRRRGSSSIPGELELVFKHQLTREVAYATLTKTRRARLHATFAAWLERFGGGRDEYAPLVAHHLAQAVRPEDADLAWAAVPDELERLRVQAVRWLRRAAELATGRYELHEALAMLDRALALTDEGATRIEILRQIATAHHFNYDMEPFRRSLEEALTLRPERTVAADIYAELAHYGYGRAYMWKEPPTEAEGKQWVERALELAELDTEARGIAVLASALRAPGSKAGIEAAKEALSLGEALDKPLLVLQACEAHALIASTAGRFQEACEWADRARETGPRAPDPGWHAHQFFLSGFVYLRAGRTADVLGFADEFDRLVTLLTPHDEMHAVALRSVLESSRGRWPELSQITTRARAASDANVDTPCQFNWRSLLVCALGLAHVGEERAARELEERARAGAVVAGPPEREPALLRLALLRGDIDSVERILQRLPVTFDPWGLDAAAAQLDALVALGDRARVEAEAAPYLEEESYTRPFALRAVGVVTGRRTLLEQALAAFERLGLEWHASETKALLAATSIAG